MSNSNTEKAVQTHLSLIKDTVRHPFNSVTTPMHHRVKNSFTALWLQTGSIKINNMPVAPGAGAFVTATDEISCSSDDTSIMFRFVVTANPLSTADIKNTNTLSSEIIDTQKTTAHASTCLLRLDQVDFPPNAVAYKHTHPGPGIRYLVDGGLTLSSEHGEQSIQPGDAWFEAANTPVIATAMNNVPSRFVRAMLLPLEYEARSTFTLQNQSDADKPRLQTNIRHAEQRIDLAHTH